MPPIHGDGLGSKLLRATIIATGSLLMAAIMLTIGL